MSLWSKFLFRYNLLCDNCNWEFTGFAVPGTVSAKPTRNPKKKLTNKVNEDLNGKMNEGLNENLNNDTSIDYVGELQKEPTENLISLENLAGPSLETGKKKANRKSGV
jgi:hypothetical protein